MRGVPFRLVFDTLLFSAGANSPLISLVRRFGVRVLAEGFRSNEDSEDLGVSEPAEARSFSGEASVGVSGPSEAAV